MTTDDLLLSDRQLRDALRAEVGERGYAAVTMTSLATRAGVSRMTAYRRAGSVDALAIEVLTEDLAGVRPGADFEGSLDDVIGAILNGAGALAANTLFRAVLAEHPSLFMPYATHRFGRVQKMFRDRLAELIAVGQERGSVRAGDPMELAATLVIALQGFLLLRAAEMNAATSTRSQVEALVRRYLASEIP